MHVLSPRAILHLVLLLLLVQAPARAERDDWFVLELDGSKMGWARERSEVAGDGSITSMTDMQLSMARMGVAIEMRLTTRFVETADGEPLWMELVTEQGTARSVERYEWTGEGVVHRSTSGGREQRKVLEPPKGTWLTPGEVERYFEKRLAAGADKIVYSSIDPTMGLRTTLSRHERLGPAQIEDAAGDPIETVRWRVTNSAVPSIRTTEYLDAEGNAILVDVPIGGMAMVMRAAPRDVAVAEFRPPEMMVDTLVRATGEVPTPRSLRRAVYRLSLEDGEALVDLPTTAAQRVARIDAETLLVVVDMDAPVPATDAEIADPAYLAPCAMIDGEDPRVVELARGAVAKLAEDASTAEVAEALRRFVHGYVEEKSLSVAFATSSEVAASAAGDCSEHAVLLAALLRARGIPSRVASGLVFVEEFVAQKDVFGYHMWTQALLDGPDGTPVWVDLDAVFPEAFDATHIVVSTTSMDDGDMVDSLTNLALLLNRLAITVESTGAPVPAAP